ncbi:hypothetical protein WICPIJ_008409 [Wickerhamomyces pijperi]|uniref:Uncharacterized protein n=1 Tax=Wickerhamomyces pijperi TaxID=599730 RepID=A0A9P8PX20_WICPI|nr:hypothetical protein WICPIJ_008409 [Wickerhamomyces pijperi]
MNLLSPQDSGSISPFAFLPNEIWLIIIGMSQTADCTLKISLIKPELFKIVAHKNPKFNNTQTLKLEDAAHYLDNYKVLLYQDFPQTRGYNIIHLFNDLGTPLETKKLGLCTGVSSVVSNDKFQIWERRFSPLMNDLSRHQGGISINASNRIKVRSHIFVFTDLCKATWRVNMNTEWFSNNFHDKLFQFNHSKLLELVISKSTVDDPQNEALVSSDYGYPFLNSEVFPRLKTLIIFNSSKTPLRLNHFHFEHLDLLTIQTFEFETLRDVNLPNLRELRLVHRMPGDSIPYKTSENLGNNVLNKLRSNISHTAEDLQINRPFHVPKLQKLSVDINSVFQFLDSSTYFMHIRDVIISTKVLESFSFSISPFTNYQDKNLDAILSFLYVDLIGNVLQKIKGPNNIHTLQFGVCNGPGTIPVSTISESSGGHFNSFEQLKTLVVPCSSLAKPVTLSLPRLNLLSLNYSHESSSVFEFEDLGLLKELNITVFPVNPTAEQLWRTEKEEETSRSKDYTFLKFLNSLRFKSPNLEELSLRYNYCPSELYGDSDDELFPPWAFDMFASKWNWLDQKEQLFLNVKTLNLHVSFQEFINFFKFSKTQLIVPNLERLWMDVTEGEWTYETMETFIKQLNGEFGEEPSLKFQLQSPELSFISIRLGFSVLRYEIVDRMHHLENDLEVESIKCLIEKQIFEKTRLLRFDNYPKLESVRLRDDSSLVFQKYEFAKKNFEDIIVYFNNTEIKGGSNVSFIGGGGLDIEVKAVE